MSSLKLAYGVVFSFDELMREFLNVFQLTTESVTDYVVRLEKAFALLRDNYPKELSKVNKIQHLRERFYQGLRKEIHQRLTPSYEDRSVPYIVLIKRARRLEADCCPKTRVTVKKARDDPQMQNVFKTLKEIRNQIEQKEDPAPPSRKKWKGVSTCYFCGGPGHWRKICPQMTPRKRKTAPKPTRSSESLAMEGEESSTIEKELKPTPAIGSKSTKKSKLPTKPQNSNPEPVARMFGRANEATVEVNGVLTTCLVDTGTTVTIVNAEFCANLGLEVHSIDGLISVSATGRANIPYLGYTVATSEFPNIPNYSEEVVMLVISDPIDYASRVPLQIGTRVIAAVTETLKPGDIRHLDETWRQTYVGTLMSCAVQQKNQDPRDSFQLEGVKGPVKLRREEELGPFEQKEVWRYTKFRGHSKRVVVCTEAEDLMMRGQVMSVNTKSEMMPHNTRVKVLLRNLSAILIMPAKTTTGEVTPCNVVPPIWKLEVGAKPEKPDTPKPDDMEKLFEDLGLNEPKDFMTPEDVQKAKELVQKIHTIFSKNDLDLGKTDKVKYKIKVTDPVPFKVRYRRIPPSQYEAVRKHLQEMLDLGAIRPSDSSWCSAVALVKKKNGDERLHALTANQGAELTIK